MLALRNRVGRRASDTLEDLNARGGRDTGALHSSSELRVVGKGFGLGHRGELVGDEDVVGIGWGAQNAMVGATVLGTDGLNFVVDRTPRGVIGDGMADDKCCAHDWTLSLDRKLLASVRCTLHVDWFGVK